MLRASRLQNRCAQATNEAGFTSLTHCVREIQWIFATLTELGVKKSGPTVVHQDNLGAICWTKDGQSFRKVKPIGIRYHYVPVSFDQKSVE